MVRGRDSCWEHCVLVDATRQKVRCNYCQREFSGGVYRMKFHLAQIKNKDIVPCTEVPDDVRDLIHSILSSHKKQKVPKKPKTDHAPNGPQHSSSAASGYNDKIAGSSGQHGSTCPSLQLPLPSPDAHPMPDETQKQKYDNADSKIALFFFHNSIPFSASKSIYYEAMVDAIADCGAGYKPPTFEVLRSTLLEKVKEEINENYRKQKDEWKDTGCTILSDSWSDGRSRSLLVLSVASPKGTQFLKLVDVSSRADDACYLFELLDSVIMEVGVENVVQVITDSATSYACAINLLLKKYPSLFWSPCASYCIEKMLEDISKQDWVSTALEEARTIARFIYSDGWILSMVKKFIGGKELVRPKLTRFVTHFLTLRSIVLHEDNLKHLFSHADWLSSVHSRRPDAQAIKSLLYLERFWKAAHEVIGISEPLLKFLRLVDGDMPAIGYIYEGIEKAKLAIKSFYKGCEEKYMHVLDIIERRWSMHLHSHLHAAAAFLNPSIFYNQSFKFDGNVRNGFHAAMWKMFPEENDRIELIKEQPVYLNAQGALGSKFAVMGRTVNSPGDWWTVYGYEVPVLQRAAVRILSQPCSSYRFKWNWNTFDNIYTKNYNKMELEKLSDLVFVHCNLRLQAISQSRGTKCRPVIFDEIDVGSEWPTESESSSLQLDDSWLDNLPIDCRGSSPSCD
ncbi:transposase-like protein [Canna indica]|uniref:Transposase-like protein n=1 Tax=Canna indica TaxID=4628 RepID=A0AAQ3K3H8_9LILI|nr:transposase-like protein [Canna indica]